MSTQETNVHTFTAPPPDDPQSALSLPRTLERAAEYLEAGEIDDARPPLKAAAAR